MVDFPASTWDIFVGFGEIFPLNLNYYNMNSIIIGIIITK